MVTTIVRKTVKKVNGSSPFGQIPADTRWNRELVRKEVLVQAISGESTKAHSRMSQAAPVNPKSQTHAAVLWESHTLNDPVEDKTTPAEVKVTAVPLTAGSDDSVYVPASPVVPETCAVMEVPAVMPRPVTSRPTERLAGEADETVKV